MNKKILINTFFSLFLILILSNILFNYFGLRYPKCYPENALCDPAIGIIAGEFLRFVSSWLFIVVYIIFEIQFFRKKDLLVFYIVFPMISFVYVASFLLYYVNFR